MKSETQVAASSKAQISKGVKSVRRKATSSAKRTPRTANKLTKDAKSTLGGYSVSAQRLIKRGKAAFGDASTWAGETASALPKTARNLGVPNQRDVQTFMSDKPLIVGAVGLGLGVVLGAMIPSRTTTAKPARRR
jgi:hypothetical protein